MRNWKQMVGCSILGCSLFPQLEPLLAQGPRAGSAVTEQKRDPLAELKTANPQRQAEIIKLLQTSSTIDLKQIGAAMVDANPVQKNIYLAVAQSVLSKDPKSSIPQIVAILEDKKQDPVLRFWAFTEVTKGNPDKRNEKLRGMLEDPALSLRYEAVKFAVSEIKKSKEGGADDAKLKGSYQTLLASARLPEQIQEIADELKKLDAEVDLLKHFGFVSEWKVIASFDNAGQKGFDVVYEPEQTYLATGKIFPQAKYDGKKEKVSWQDASTKEKDGAVDLNPVFKNEKGAICYAFAEFTVKDSVDCEVRLGCTNANKAWVNGKLALSNETYHTGGQIDQYPKKVTLNPGVNTVLVKVCQNEQTEQWAQDWKFQLRFTDASGLPIRQSK